MIYEEHRPSPALAPFVECIWRAVDDAPDVARPPEAIAPDGCLEWIFHRAAPYAAWDARGEAAVQPASLLVGLGTHPTRIAPTGRVDTLGVRFRPGGAHPFLRLPLEELADASVDAPAVFGSAGARLTEEMGNAPTAESARHAVEAFLLRRRIDAPASRPLRNALDRLLRSGGRASVGALAESAAWSPRQLEREFRRRVGLSPKALSRIARFQNLLRLASRDPRRGWAELAGDAGYADQAHMTREFRALSGATPAARTLGEGELGRHFVDAERLDALLGRDVGIVQDAEGPMS
jgi:AraC-like DNA-binding protein